MGEDDLPGSDGVVVCQDFVGELRVDAQEGTGGEPVGDASEAHMRKGVRDILLWE